MIEATPAIIELHRSLAGVPFLQAGVRCEGEGEDGNKVCAETCYKGQASRLTQIATFGPAFRQAHSYSL